MIKIVSNYIKTNYKPKTFVEEIAGVEPIGICHFIESDASIFPISVADNEVLNNKNIEIQNNDISIGFYDKYIRNGDEIYFLN